MDNRKTSADFYPGGKTAISAGGGITSGEGGGNGSGVPTVPVTKVSELPERYRESDMRSKINELARVISGGVAAIIAMVSLTLGAEPVKVLGVKKDALWNDDFVVTNVVADFAGFATTNTVTRATNALAATFQRGLEVATNAVLQAGAKEIAAATNALSQSVDARLRASTNGSFSASSLEPYAKRTWVEAQGYLKSTNLTGYAQVDWVQNQRYIRENDLESMVNNSIAKQEGTSAYRLMAPDRSEWIDGTGVCWQVTSHVEVRDRHMAGGAYANEWLHEETEGTGCRINVRNEVQEDGLKWDVEEIQSWQDDPEDPESPWSEVKYQWGGYVNPTNGEVVLQAEYFNEPDKNGNFQPETISLRYWLETNAVNRIAFDTDVEDAIRRSLTTDEVKDVVEEVVNGSGWAVSVDIPENDCMSEAELALFREYVKHCEVRWIEDEFGDKYWKLTNLNIGALTMEERDHWLDEIPTTFGPGQDAERITFRIFNEQYEPWRYVYAEANRINGLGLAKVEDVDRKFEEAINAIPAVVTNKIRVAGWDVKLDGVAMPGWKIVFSALPEEYESDVTVDLVDDMGIWQDELGIGMFDLTNTTFFAGEITDGKYAGKFCEARWVEEHSNALGLAMAKDVEKKFAEATNAIPSIVTNCVDGGYSAWTFYSDNAELELALAANPPKVESKFWADLGMPEWLVTFPDVEGFEKDFQGSLSVTNTYDAPPVELYCGRVYTFRRYNPEWEGYEWIGCSVSATREKLPARNALGLATLKDIEGAVTKQELTNTVRTVVNAAGRYVWDRELEVCYRLNLQGGFLDLIAVTNIDLTLPENYLALEAIENEWRTK